VVLHSSAGTVGLFARRFSTFSPLTFRPHLSFCGFPPIQAFPPHGRKTVVSSCPEPPEQALTLFSFVLPPPLRQQDFFPSFIAFFFTLVFEERSHLGQRMGGYIPDDFAAKTKGFKDFSTCVPFFRPCCFCAVVFSFFFFVWTMAKALGVFAVFQIERRVFPNGLFVDPQMKFLALHLGPSLSAGPFSFSFFLFLDPGPLSFLLALREMRYFFFSPSAGVWIISPSSICGPPFLLIYCLELSPPVNGSKNFSTSLEPFLIVHGSLSHSSFPDAILSCPNHLTRHRHFPHKGRKFPGRPSIGDTSTSLPTFSPECCGEFPLPELLVACADCQQPPPLVNACSSHAFF